MRVDYSQISLFNSIAPAEKVEKPKNTESEKPIEKETAANFEKALKTAEAKQEPTPPAITEQVERLKELSLKGLKEGITDTELSILQNKIIYLLTGDPAYYGKVMHYFNAEWDEQGNHHERSPEERKEWHEAIVKVLRPETGEETIERMRFNDSKKVCQSLPYK